MTCLVSEHCGHSLSNQQDLPKHWKIVISDINSSCLLSVNKLLNWQTNLIAITLYFFHICFFVWRISWLVFSLSFIAWKMMDRTQLWRMSRPKQLRISTRILGTRLPLTSFTDLLYALSHVHNPYHEFGKKASVLHALMMTCDSHFQDTNRFSIIKKLRRGNSY